MKTITRHISKLVATGMLLVWVQLAFAGSDDVQGFQGLQWGATENEVYNKYRGQIRKAECTPVTELSSKAFHHACDHPVIENYEVVGIPFILDFYLTEGTRRLDGVSLYYSRKIDGADGLSWPQMRDEWSRKYRSIRDVLNDKYGKPDNEGINTIHTPTSLAFAEAVWKRGNTIIKLSAKLSKGGGFSAPWQDFSINYRSASGGESAKL